MNILKNVGAIMIGTLSLLLGCAGTDDKGDDEVLGTASQAGGTDHSNGLDPDVAIPCWGDVITAMGSKLVVNGHLIATLPASLLPGGACQDSLRYAYACAGASGTTLPIPATQAPAYPADLYTGDQILSTAMSWRDLGGLNIGQKQDILTCMAALLNPNAGIDVCLSGPSVSAGNCYTYSVQEAVFKARIARRGLVFDVWPLVPAELCDPTALQKALGERLCNGNWEACNFSVRSDLATACTVQDGEYDCGGPAIRTLLTVNDYLTMYPGCAAPAQ